MFKQWRVERFHLDQCLWYGQFENADNRNWDVGKKWLSSIFIYVIFVLPSFIFRVILSSFISFITRIEREKASVHVPSRNNLIFQSIPQSVDGQQQQQNYFHPKYIYIYWTVYLLCWCCCCCVFNISVVLYKFFNSRSVDILICICIWSLALQQTNKA